MLYSYIPDTRRELLESPKKNTQLATKLMEINKSNSINKSLRFLFLGEDYKTHDFQLPDNYDVQLRQDSKIIEIFVYNKVEKKIICYLNFDFDFYFGKIQFHHVGVWTDTDKKYCDDIDDILIVLFATLAIKMDIAYFPQHKDLDEQVLLLRLFTKFIACDQYYVYAIRGKGLCCRLFNEKDLMAAWQNTNEIKDKINQFFIITMDAYS